MEVSGTKKYYPELDIVKGIAILLVILGHSFCSFPFDLNAQLPPVLGKIVRSFQMPLFFIASGFLFSRKAGFGVFIRKKMFRLVLPWIVFSVLSVVLRISFSSFTHGGDLDILNSPYEILQGHYYWFLYALAIIMVVCYIVKNRYVLMTLCILSVVCCLVTGVKDIEAFTVGRIAYYFPFFCSGMLIKHFYSSLMDNKVLAIVLLVLSVAVYVIFIGVGCTWRFVELYVITLSGSLLTWGLAVLLVRWKMPLLKHFGHYSLQYYLNHLLIMLPVYYVAKFMPISPVLQLLTIWTIATAISWLMLRVQMKFKVFRLLCGIS